MVWLSAVCTTCTPAAARLSAIRATTPGTPCIPAPIRVTFARSSTERVRQPEPVERAYAAAARSFSATVNTSLWPAGVNMSSDTPASASARYTSA